MSITVNIKKLMVSLLIIGSSVVWDYEKIGDWIRTGKTKWLFLFAIIYGSIKVAEKWRNSVGALFFISMGSFLWTNMGVLSVLDAFSVISCIFLIPIIMKEDVEVIVNCVIVAAILNSGLAILQLMGLNPIWFTNGAWVINAEMGFLGHPTIFGPLAVCGVGCSLYNGLKKNRLWLIAALIMSIQCLLTASVMTIVSLGAVLLLYIHEMYSKKLSYFLLAACVVACLVLKAKLPQAMSDTGRYFWWGAAWQYIKNAPLFGYGLGVWPNYAVEIARKSPQLGASPVFGQMHNDYLQAFFELGLFGMAALAWIFYDVVKEAIFALKYHKESIRFAAMFLAIAVNSMGNFPVRIAPLALIFGMSAYYFIGHIYARGNA